jgi:DNA-binding response OmpR family regulator
VADSIDPSFDGTIAFGPFVLIPSRQLLLKTDQPIPIGARAFEILVCLVQRAGEIVSKEDLIARVWPKVFVQEGNLKVRVATLRQVVPGRIVQLDIRVARRIPLIGVRCSRSERLTVSVSAKV